MEEQWATITPVLRERLGLTREMLPAEVSDVWQLCEFQAGRRIQT